MTDQSDHNAPPEKIRVGVSSCLLGFEVRFDKGHKRDSYVNRTLSEHFEFVPVCPEVAIGLGTPREPIRRVGNADRPRASFAQRNAKQDVVLNSQVVNHATLAVEKRPYGKPVAEKLAFRHRNADELLEKPHVA